MSNVYDFEAYYWERHNLEAIWEARSGPEGVDIFVEPGFEMPPDALPLPQPKPRVHDLRMLAELTSKLGWESGFRLPIDETALEAAFHFAKEQAGHMNVPVEAAFEIAAWAVLNYERARRDPPRLADPPF
ncbi:MAG: hypothetical protein OXG99_12105 [Alphaproteobacteria bacterium]|nr:hypothetical protein [Alphaproteobacteria bacterium]